MKKIIFITLTLLLTSCNSAKEISSIKDTQTISTTKNFTSKLLIPPILEDKDKSIDKDEFDISVQKGKVKFLNELETNTYGYNGNFLGPVIRVKSGNEVKVNVKNNLGEDTTIHWHGLEIPSDMDGGPDHAIKSNTEWHPSFKISQQAGTYWFHPHTFEKTGEQVYKGLAGLFIVDDKNSESLDIPNNYGVNDIPLILQDRRFNKDGSFDYKSQMIDNDGMLGDKILVNGVINPYLEIKENRIRFRVLNGSNARIYKIALSDNSEFYQIASDGGLLEKPILLKSLMLASGERAEIVVDFSKYKDKEEVILKSLAYENKEKTMTSESVSGRIENGKDLDLIKFVVKKENTDLKSTTFSLPNDLTKIERLQEKDSSKVRKFELTDMSMDMGNMPMNMDMSGSHSMHTMSTNNMYNGMFRINNKVFDLSRVDESVKLNDTEVWEITNKSQMLMPHPFHIHGVQFQILARNSKEPSLNEKGWKDTVLVQPDETVKIIAKFKNKGMFMYHCHTLEH
ncbi:MAG: multicopper oxidase family protein, partial [Candidatus Sericytochromatia bacterium]